MKIVTIDLDKNNRRDGHCHFCSLPRTMFPAKLENGAWTSACRGCAERDAATVMQ